ncbi:MAG: alkaline phosphatase D family protein, partial [Bacteroidota bacterium]
TIALEFGTPSITSSNSDEGNPVEKVLEAEKIFLEKNPHLKYTDLRNHGYLLLRLNEAEATAEWHYVDKLNVPSDGVRMDKQYTVSSGHKTLE